MNNLVHTPDGVRDIYGEECICKHEIEKKLIDTMHAFGYKSIETPTFEFFEVFSKERGSVGDQYMYKFFDRENHTLVLRPDVTPAIARAATKLMGVGSLPLKLCYMQNTFINQANHRGMLTETTQSGVELVGGSSASEDAEVLALAIRTLLAAGLEDFKVEIGHAGFIKALLGEINLSEEDSRSLRWLIENKNFFGVMDLANQTMDKRIGYYFMNLHCLRGNFSIIKDVLGDDLPKKAKEVVERLSFVQSLLEIYGLSEYVYYDLGMLSTYNYYTGVIFKAFAYGSGDYILSGGRYDNLFAQFGMDTGAIGFSITMDRLLGALRAGNSEKIAEDGLLLLYEKAYEKEAIVEAMQRRMDGKSVNTIVREKEIAYYIEYAKKNGIGMMYYISEKGKEAILDGEKA